MVFPLLFTLHKELNSREFIFHSFVTRVDVSPINYLELLALKENCILDLPISSFNPNVSS